MKKSLLIVFVFLSYLIHYLSPVSFALSLESYCKDGYYQIPGEDQCSRAPNCGGKGYDDVAALSQPNPQACMGDGSNGREGKGCSGYVPVCCYEVERTHDPTMCVGYWERLWCAPSQCANLDPEKAAICNGGGGGNCACAHAFSSYCGDKPPIPLEVRLGLKSQPTTIPPTTIPPSALPEPTSPVIPTSIPTKFTPPHPTSSSSRLPTQGQIPPPTAFVSPLPQQPPNTIGVGSFMAKIQDTIPNMKISAVKTVIASKKILDLPKYSADTVLTLDKKLELFMNDLLRKMSTFKIG